MIMFVKMEKSFILAQFLADIITKNYYLLLMKISMGPVVMLCSTYEQSTPYEDAA